MLAWGKHSSLLRKFVTYGHKSLITQTPGACQIQALLENIGQGWKRVTERSTFMSDEEKSFITFAPAATVRKLFLGS